ncbi:hypothetical protein AVEN_226584-1 [Araneus ventricosus]|uniref:Uncharacterized protein n=1 Tax=Araneus ventricosus TaxID=182803 RepID=A0A4Y2JQD6_ARAVE|nr:hypothetical protein AVEN_226584-1 [Araneus ventricosus]
MWCQAMSHMRAFPKFFVRSRSVKCKHHPSIKGDILRSQSADSKVPGMKLDSTKDPLCMLASCILNLTLSAKRPLSGVVRKFREEVPIEVSSSSSDHSSKMDTKNPFFLINRQKTTAWIRKKLINRWFRRETTALEKVNAYIAVILPSIKDIIPLPLPVQPYPWLLQPIVFTRDGIFKPLPSPKHFTSTSRSSLEASSTGGRSLQDLTD